MMTKKAENRPLTPEEYDQMNKFVDRVEKRSAARLVEKREEDNALLQMRAEIPAELFNLNILKSNLPKHTAEILQDAGYPNVGELVFQVKHNSDSILALQGIGPHAMQEIVDLVEKLTKVEAEPEVVPEIVAEIVEQPEVVAPAEIIEVSPEPIVETGEVAVVEPITVAEPGVVVEEEEPTFDKLFTLKPDMVTPTETAEEEEDEEGKKGAKKKKKKSKHVEVTYDPDRDLVIAKKKHKRSDGEWEWEP
jgi:N utilization substance protein A